MPKVFVQNEALEVEAGQDENLRTALRRQGISVYDNVLTSALNCRGKGFCGTCKVIVMEGRDNLSTPTDREKRKLKTRLEGNIRLSCQTRVSGDIEVHCHP